MTPEAASAYTEPPFAEALSLFRLAGTVTAYRGLLPFADILADQALFCGRDTEADQLASQIAASPIVLMFGRSGLGKTSMVAAGVLPRLRRRAFLPLMVRLPTNDMHGSDASPGEASGPRDGLIDQIVARANAACATLEGESDKSSLWAFFCTTQFRVDGRVVRPVLIVDQFEELFSRVTPELKADLIDQLSDFARNRAPDKQRKEAEQQLEEKISDKQREKLTRLAYGQIGHDAKFVLVIREEFLPQLEELKARIPAIFRSTYRLLPFTPDKARDAIVIPAQRVGPLGGRPIIYEPAAVDQIVDFLKMKIINGSEVPGDNVEPMQLQILCSDLERRCFITDRFEIAAADLGGVKGMRHAIDDYYQHVIAGLPKVRRGWSGRRHHASRANWLLFNFPRTAARALCETRLVTPLGQRNSIQHDVITTEAGVPQDDLDHLVDNYLLRTDRRLDSEFYELSHDSLVAILQGNRRKRRQIERFVAVAAVLLVLFTGAVTAARVFHAQIETWQVDRALRHIAANPDDSFQQVRDIRWLLTTQTKLAFPARLVIKGKSDRKIDLRNLQAIAPRFIKPTFKYTQFDGSDLSQSVFSEASIEDVSFVRANLEFARFSGSSISSTDFSGANLGRSNFDRVVFGDGVQFSSTDLFNASFYQTNFDKGVPDFSNTAWWLAYGWSEGQRNMLETKFPHSAYIRSEAFQRMRARFEAEARDAVTGSATQADDLNDLAWMLAINGADLGKADECVEKAIATLGTINQTLAPAEVKRRLAVYKDTLGYILLQMDIDQPSDATLKKAADLLKEAGEINDDEETFFKHAVAAFALGDKSAALTELRISVGERRYRPSHELLMLRPFLHDEFSAELAGLLRIDEKKAVDRQRDSR